MIKQSRTPFDIRLELLELAASVLTNKHKALAASTNPHLTAQDLTVSTYPTTEEIIAEAEKMNKFVSKTANSM